MHGLDTSNVSSRVESSQVEFELYFEAKIHQIRFPDIYGLVWIRELKDCIGSGNMDLCQTLV